MKKKANRVKWKIRNKDKKESVSFWSKNKIKRSLKLGRKVRRNTRSRTKRNKTNNAVKRRRRKGSWEKITGCDKTSTNKTIQTTQVTNPEV